jgi:MFS transporter, DHA3 family, macrolide efflux protein
LAGPLAEYVFEPAMMPGGALADSMGKIIGIGPGRGLALMFLVLGLAVALVAAAGYAIRCIRRVEQDIPDAPLPMIAI